MKKFAAIVLLTVMCAASLLGLSGCAGNDIWSRDDGKIHVVATIFPEYDWVMNVLGDRADEVEVTLLLDDGVDPHSFQPTAQDIMKVASCDLFVYVGGESETWVPDALKESINDDQRTVALMDVLADRTHDEELVEGMQTRGEEEEAETDEHVWLSLRNAELAANAIAAELAILDPDHADEYAANAASYTNALADLDSAYAATVEEAPLDTILLADRFPFLYLAKDYGLNYYAAFQGCSAETEATFSTIAFLADKVNELDLPAVLLLENSDEGMAETVVENTQRHDQLILRLDSMQSTSGEDVSAGATYIGIMESNLKILRQALGC